MAKKRKEARPAHEWVDQTQTQAGTRSTRWLGRKEPFVRNRKTGRCLTGDPRCATRGDGDDGGGRWEVGGGSW